MSELNRILRNGGRLFLRVRLFLRRLQPVAKPVRMCTEIVYRLARGVAAVVRFLRKVADFLDVFERPLGSRAGACQQL